MPTSQGESGYPGGAGCSTVVDSRRRRAGTADNGVDDESGADGVVSRPAGLALSSDWSLWRAKHPAVPFSKWHTQCSARSVELTAGRQAGRL
jgi:hypothetical protein